METKLKEYIKKSGLNSSRCAIALGINISQFNQFVNGQRPNKKTATKIAEAFGVDPKEIWPDYDGLRRW
jgi:plasmid maintenance system antidote protein VapI